MTQAVLVTGAAGRTGRAVVGALLARGALVVGLVRSDDKAAIVAKLGAQPIRGDLDRPETLLEAARGCGTIVHIGPPMHPHEVEHVRAMIEAARTNGVVRFVYYSVMQPLRQDVEHHRLKLHAEAEVVESGLPYTIVQPCRYMQHLEPIWPQVVDEGIHAMPFSVHQPFSVVDLEDLAEATARVATEADHADASYELAGPQKLSQQDMAAILSERLGRPVTARQIPLDELESRARAAGIAPERIARMVRMNRHYDRHGFRGNPNVLRWLLGREPTSYAAYVDRLKRARS